MHYILLLEKWFPLQGERAHSLNFFCFFVCTVPVKKKFPLRSSKTLQSRFRVGKKTLNDFKKRRLFFTHRSFFPYRCLLLLIYASLTICAENLFLLRPLIAKLSTETEAFLGFSASSSPACLFLDAFRRSLLFLVAVVFSIVSLSVIRCRPSQPFHSLTSASPVVALPFSRLLRLPVAVVGFLVVLLFRRQPLIRSLQLCRRHRRPATRFYFSF